ncbi:di-heme-cytochrome C peroxidase [Ensifer adhaerens]|uniref:di-heme-cytochrome C peroxidase n=1 Tax=Ensifer adhaerens TaxID=106592 RepID=UPI00384E6F48
MRIGRLPLLLCIAILILNSTDGGGHARADSLPNGVQALDQGWNDEQRSWWYTASQGSRLLPLDWMQALETSGSTETFLSAANVARLGYLPNPVSTANPLGLPVGFAVDQDKTRSADLMCNTFPAACDALTMRKPWIGFNCSACHTNEIVYQDKRIRVDGASTLADFQAFEEELLASLKATLDDRAKFDRFARKVLKNGISVDSRASLESQLREQIAWQQLLADKNRSKVRYGHGRLDAQGHILNKVALVTRQANQPDTVQADAPASYPFIWNTSQQGKIQWNGIANNIFKVNLLGKETDIGALVRNTSEVIGVFAHIETDRGKAWRGYDSSVRISSMLSLERQLAKLKSPRWPENILPPIDWDKAARGRVHFETFKCAGCHKPLAWDDLDSPAQERMDPLAKQKTDIFLACNTFLHRSKSGNQQGQKIFAFAGDKIGAIEFTRNLLVNATVGAVVGQLDELAGGIFNDVSPTGGPVGSSPEAAGVEYLPGVSNIFKKERARLCLTSEHELLAYKARPLNGIWSTAPYLHNGSVPSLYDLLLPAKVRNIATDEIMAEMTGPTRTETFSVGSREFDPIHVGFVKTIVPGDSSFVFRVRDEETGEPIPGNYNSGHEYGTSSLSEDQRLELVEYLKTL